jgi:hypothetical protein
MNATEIKANRLILDKRNTLVHDGRGWVVFGAFSASDLEAALDMHAGNVVSVQFSTYSEKTAKHDLSTYGRRLSKLSARYTFGGFAPLVIDGHTLPNKFVGILNRSM